MSIIILAAHEAKIAHAGQRRKHVDEEYIMHCMRVAGRVSLLPDTDEFMVATGWLHDTFEDCQYPHTRMLELFGPEVCSQVMALTNPSKEFPHYDRATKKAMDREHLRTQPVYIRQIKMCDRIDNLWSAFNGPIDWAKTYLEESKLLAEAIVDPHDPAMHTLNDQLMDACRQLGDSIADRQPLR